MPDSKIAELAARVEARCRLEGHFELASGETSDYYFDAKAALLAADLKFDIARALWVLASGLTFEAIGGQAVGAVPMAEHMSMLARYEMHRDVDTFYVREERKKHGTQQDVFQAHRPDGTEMLRPGTRVLILDDVLTTGGSLQIAIDAVKRAGASVAGVMVLVDRRHPDADRLRHDPSFQFRALFEADERGRLSPARSLTVA